MCTGDDQKLNAHVFIISTLIHSSTIGSFILYSQQSVIIMTIALIHFTKITKSQSESRNVRHISVKAYILQFNSCHNTNFSTICFLHLSVGTDLSNFRASIWASAFSSIRIVIDRLVTNESSQAYYTNESSWEYREFQESSLQGSDISWLVEIKIIARKRRSYYLDYDRLRWSRRLTTKSGSMLITNKVWSVHTTLISPVSQKKKNNNKRREKSIHISSLLNLTT